MKILCIHGIGGKDATSDEWHPIWAQELAHALNQPEENLIIEFLSFDDLFTEYQKKNGIKYFKIVLQLIRDWVRTSIFGTSKGGSLPEMIRWYAGMAVQFVQDEELRDALHQRLEKKLEGFEPHLIYAHSLGTLVAYDYLRQKTVTHHSFSFNLITSGSQIGHPALLRFFGGKIESLAVKHWYNLHNESDKVFAYEPIAIEAGNFSETETPFSDGIFSINHDEGEYILHPNALRDVWPLVGTDAPVKKSLIAASSVKQLRREVEDSPNQKALLFGIDDYPDPENQLNGCVNDVFRMSEVLQEIGFLPEDITVVLNERATSDCLKQSMDWLLGDARDGDTRFFYYSGHGTQIPSGGTDPESDHVDECLVTYDFDWSRERCYTDKEFLAAYSKLSYGVNFIAMLDCCNAGGMTRDGSFKARGLNPPDDIRHRSIKWDPIREMWIPRTTMLEKERLFSPKTIHKNLFVGEDNNLHRFGRAVSLWTDVEAFEEARIKYGTKGPYMPLLLEACKENEYSFEYRHGVTSFGAFTYCMSTILREYNRSGRKEIFTFVELVNLVRERLALLGYNQTPQVVGPREKINAAVPFLNVH